jgi:hypothetical protein
MARAPTDFAVRLRAIERRLGEIEIRLTELRRAAPAKSQSGLAPEVLVNAQWHAREAQRHWQESTVRVQVVRRVVIEAFRKAARAHDQAADAIEKSASVRTGGVAEQQQAKFHRAAAVEDRRRAAEIQEQAELPVADASPGSRQNDQRGSLRAGCGS